MKHHRHQISFKQQLRIVMIFMIILTVIEVINFFTFRSLVQLGISPRNISSLPFILTAPFVHGGLWHFLSNIVPLGIFSFLLLQHGRTRFFMVTVTCILLTGICVWLFARSANHVGASGLIYSYFGYLLFAGIISREFKLIVISIVVGFVYGGMVFGVLPLNAYVSWESHLFGLLSGIACAFLWGKLEAKEMIMKV
ncbi:MAG: rhomboid family intramembrane serine protease [Oleispira sp.]